jgi:hypothetical protein
MPRPAPRRLPLHRAGLLLVVALLLVTTLAACSSPPGEEARSEAVPATSAPAGDLAAGWNQLALALAQEEDGFLTLKGVRTAAMMHVAMHDALNTIRPEYETYAYDGSATEGDLSTADPRAAAAQAAYEVVVGQFPDREADLAAELQRWLDAAGGGPASELGRRIGRDAAAAIEEQRQGDGWDGEAEYQWHPMGPGVYAEFHEHSNTPEGFVFGAGWAAAAPFLLPTADHFRSPPPPAIGSDAYTAAFDEVKEVGRDESTLRTADQTHLALWWKDFAENSHNRLARQLVRDEEVELWTAARLFALLNMSIYDGYVNVFDNKFHYNHWRPYTAIRWAAHDGNPATVPEPQWNNTHHHTYAFPSYPSAHGTVCAAAMTVIADTFGNDHPFTMSTPEVDSAGPFSEKMAMEPPTRSFASFSDAAWECAMSRVYLGIHFRYDSVAGNDLGRQIGVYGLSHHLRSRNS